MAIVMATTLGSCSPSQHQASPALVSARLSDARARDCRQTCASISLVLTVANNSNVDYCVPAEFFGDDASESIEIRANGSAEVTRQTTPVRMIPALSDGSISSYLTWLRSRPVYIVPPGSSKSEKIDLLERFEFRNHTSSVYLNLFVFPCSAREYASIGPTKLKPSAQLSSVAP